MKEGAMSIPTLAYDLALNDRDATVESSSFEESIIIAFSKSCIVIS